MANKRVGGILYIAVNGERLQAKGSFTYNHGVDKREAVVGSDQVHGFKELPQAPFIEGAITDSDELDVPTLKAVRDSTVTLELANGKVFTLSQAWYAADGDVTTEEGEIQVRFEGISATESA